MPVQGISMNYYSRHNRGAYGVSETFQVNFARNNIGVHAALYEAFGPRQNKAGIAGTQGAVNQSFGAADGWPGCAFNNSCTGVTFGLASSGDGGASGVFTIYYF